ncbi:MAG TPA: LemA family protein [Gemmatimonadaceae bacterium]
MKYSPLLLALPFTLGACGYNTIQSRDERAKAAKQQIAVQLQRRADLVPNLVETVRGFAKQESTVLENVTRARAGLSSAVTSGDVAQMANANQELGGALSRLLVVVENYPQLKSDQTFLRLQDELTGTENRVAVARTDYNQAVQDYNAYIRIFPQVLTAKVVGAKPQAYFDVTTPGAAQAPTVDFSKKP